MGNNKKEEFDIATAMPMSSGARGLWVPRRYMHCPTNKANTPSHQHVFVRRCYAFQSPSLPASPSRATGWGGYASWLRQARKSVKEVRRWSAASTEEFPYQRAECNLVCDVCGATSAEAKADDLSYCASSPHTVAPTAPRDESATSSRRLRWLASGGLHWDLAKRLRAQLRRPSVAGSNRVSDSHSAFNGIGTPASVVKGLHRAAKHRVAELDAQLTAGRQFPEVILSAEVLSCCLRMAAFSAAAYGPAYIDGFFSSVPCNASLQLPGFRSLLTPIEGVHRRAAKILLGVGSSDAHIDVVKCQTFGDASCRASCCVFVDHRYKQIILAFRGTMSTGDIITDVMSTPMALSVVRGDVVKKGNNVDASTDSLLFVPEGFGESIRHALRTVAGLLAQLEASLCDYATYITGHSLGAIQANIFHIAASGERQRHVVGFAPAPCVSWGIAKAYQATAKPDSSCIVLNFAYGHDPVPRLQVSSIRDKIHASQCTTHEQHKYYLPGTTLWMDPDLLLHAPSPVQPIPHLRRVVDFPDGGAHDHSDIVKRWNTIPSSIASVEHHFLQWIQRDLWRRLQSI